MGTRSAPITAEGGNTIAPIIGPTGTAITTSGKPPRPFRFQSNAGPSPGVFTPLGMDGQRGRPSFFARVS